MADASAHKRPKLAGVAGFPVAHSLSPLIHTIWAHRARINGYYIPFAVPPGYDDFARVMDSLRVIGFAGVNVTIPHKENALRYADEESGSAKAAGAANMLTFAADKTYADNSDVTGFAAAVREQVGECTIKSALVLGAGGAARGVVLALKELGATDIRIANRTREKAEVIAAANNLQAVDWKEKSEALGGADLVVNTTSLGLNGEPSLDLDLRALGPGAIVADIVYAPLETPLLKDARVKGNKTVDGLSMLMHQAVPGFRQWFEGDAVVDEDLRAALVSELKRRGGA